MAVLSDIPAVSISSRPLIQGNFFAMASMMAVAISMPAAEMVIPKMPPDQLGALRVSLSALFLLPFWLMQDGWRQVLGARWLRGIAVGALLGLASVTMIIGQGLGGTITAAVITAMMPLFAVTLEVFLDRRRLGLSLLTGITLSIIGGVLALDFAGGGGDVVTGVLFCCLSILLYTFGSRFTVTAFPELSLIGRTSLTISGAAITNVVIAVTHLSLGAEPADLSGWTIGDLAALLVFAVCGLSLAQVWWIAAVRRIGIGMSSLHSNATPFYVMIILWLGFGAAWNWLQAGAAGVVVLGVLIAQGTIPLPFARRS